jgi:peptidoglycan-associated lipoprotein
MRTLRSRVDRAHSRAPRERFKRRSKGGFNNMFHRRGSLFLVAPVLMLTLFLVGCPKRPATMTAGSGAAPAPTPPPAAAAPAPAPSAPSTPPTAAAPSPSTATPAPTPTPVAPPVTAPSPAPPRVTEFTTNTNLNDIHFDFDKYNIKPDDAKILDANAAWLKSNPGNLVLIEGHCDDRGTAEYTLALGERRAKSAMNYLIAQGVQANRITIISYGKERPLCTEQTENCWARNRRDHFLTKAQ